MSEHLEQLALSDSDVALCHCRVYSWFHSLYNRQKGDGKDHETQSILGFRKNDDG